MADMADLDARPVVAEAFLELALHSPVVAPLVHIDEVDDNQTGQIPRRTCRATSSSAASGWS